MSQQDRSDGAKDANDGKGPKDMQNAHWKSRQDYDAAYAAEKAKNK